jgi:hypothetical protein
MALVFSGKIGKKVASDILGFSMCPVKLHKIYLWGSGRVGKTIEGANINRKTLKVEI